LVSLAGGKIFASGGRLFMKLLIGIGNPGEKYKNIRHNAGFMCINQVRLPAGKAGTPGFVAKKSNIFMNDSGKFVKKITVSYQLSTTDLYVVHDDLDIPLGKYKIQFGKGPELHYGIQSIEEELGTKEFWRIRIGVDNRDPQNRIPGEDYVLRDFTKEELDILPKVFNEIVKDHSFPSQN